MATFDRAEFDGLVDDIERYLGWLRGNELVWEWVQKYEKDTNFEVEFGNGSPVTFRSTPSEGGLAMEFVEVVGNGDGDKVLATLAETWESGTPWAAGIGGYLTGLCANLIDVDRASMKSAMLQLVQAGDTLQGTLVENWTGLRMDSWIGEASDAFDTEVIHFTGTISNQYLAYWLASTEIFSMTCGIALKTQAGLIPFLTQVRDGLHDQLVAWTQQLPPQDGSSHDSKAVDVAKIALSIVGVLPVADAVKTAASVANTVTDIAGLVDKPAPTLPTNFRVQSAEQVYRYVGTTLADDYASAMITALDELRSKRSSSVLHEQQGIKNWMTPRYPHAADKPWVHENE